MTQKPVTQAAKTKGNDFVKAMLDLLILALLVGGAGFGGYFLGIHERLAPVQNVPPGTANAIPPPIAPTLPAKVEENAPAPKPNRDADKTAADEQQPVKSGAKSPLKYWISSSGADYTGYSITVKINDTPVDNFFGPGKNVDITRFVKKGDNEVNFECKALGEQYNKHPGDAASELVVQLVAGPHVQDDFKAAAVVLTYKRNASESEDINETKHFAAK